MEGAKDPDEFIKKFGVEQFRNILSGSITEFDYKFANINDILPNYITEALIEGIENFANKIKNYNREDAIISAVEARTSSPIKIIRDDLCQTKIVGIFPCGEGAGYAGGITSACMDGLKVAEGIVNIYNTPNI